MVRKTGLLPTAQGNTNSWLQHLITSAAADQFEERVNSADASFLVHMSSELEQSGLTNTTGSLI
jgi:hypothetical protein